MLRVCFIFFLFPFAASSQSAKLNFEKVEIARYQFNSIYTDVKDKADVVLYCHVNKSGIASLQFEDGDTLKICSYKLPDSVITIVNTFLSDKKKLTDWYEEGMPEEGVIYGSPEYKYFKIVNSGAETQSVCYIDDFMTEDFKNFLFDLFTGYEEATPLKGMKKIVTGAVIKEITEKHIRTKVLATTSHPPPLRQTIN
ncbi:MAG TPA: hypothetical protein PKD42_00140 [Chitinophagaceae bacterium]|nr:hypothetical protein [Chitinophagaceae bacterium]